MFNDMRNKALFLLTLLYRIIFALVLLIVLIYFRLIPRVSRDLWQQLNHYQVFSLSIRIAFVVVNIIFILRILNILGTKTSHPIIAYLKTKVEKITEHMTQQLESFYNLCWFIAEELMDRLFNYELLHYKTMLKITKVVLKTKYPKRLLKFLLALDIIPRIIFIVAFAYDVLITQHLHYTFYCIPLLLIPLLEKFIVFTFTHFRDLYWQSTSSVVQKTQVGSSTKYSFIPELDDDFLPGPLKLKNFMDFFQNHYSVLEELDAVLTIYKSWKTETFPYYKILLIVALLRLFLLLFIFFYGIV